MKILTIIPARSGSKRLKNKNRLNFGGKPLINWTLDFASKIKQLNSTVVSTDDKTIIETKKKFKKIIFFKRQKKISGDRVKTITIIFDVIDKYEKKYRKIDTILLLQPTSPFRSKKKLMIALDKYKKHKMHNSVVSISKIENNKKRKYKIYKNILSRENIKSKKINFQINGNFYIASKKFLKRYKSFYVKNKTLPVILSSKKQSVDIDTKKDFINAKKLI